MSIRELCALFVILLSPCRNVAYVIEIPQIKAYDPTGYSISIDHKHGVTFVAFHVNINEPIHINDVGQDFNEIYNFEHGRWTFWNSQVALDIDDRVYYWIFVMSDRVGFRKQGSFTITEKFASPHSPTTTPRTQNTPNREISFGSVGPQIDSHRTTEHACEAILLNATQSLLNFNSEIYDLTRKNEELNRWLESLSRDITLTITGALPDELDADEVVRFIIREHLKLGCKIISARRSGDHTITFDVETTTEKRAILEAASIKLKNIRIIIS